MNITKANPDIWIYLLRNNEKSPGMRFWWEMKDNYPDATKEYEKLLDEEESGSGVILT